MTVHTFSIENTWTAAERPFKYKSVLGGRRGVGVFEKERESIWRFPPFLDNM